MTKKHSRQPAWVLGIGLVLTHLFVLQVAIIAGEPLISGEKPLPRILTLPDAISWGLQNNPELATLRQQHGIAAAGVVIAQTYPFNPLYEGKYRSPNGPTAAGITNRFNSEHRVFVDVEIRGQGRFRRDGAAAALSRTDWEIAFQELTFAVRIIRAFEGVVYRQEKLHLLEETVRLNQQSADRVAKLVQSGGKLRGADLILARTEVDDSRAQLGQGRAALVTARQDLRRALGAVEEVFDVKGGFVGTLPAKEEQFLQSRAMENRPDLMAKHAGLAEAEARLRLAVADRYGNPNLGPAYEYDDTRVNFFGAQINLPLPVFNTHKGEILQREAERTRAVLDRQQTETTILQDLKAALARLDNARREVEVYKSRILPNLETGLKDMEKLFDQGDPGVDVLRIIEVRRKLLRARDGYLDSLWELTQAQADLAAAVGDPSLFLGDLSHPDQTREQSPYPQIPAVPIPGPKK